MTPAASGTPRLNANSQPLGPRAALGDQNVAEAVVPDQDRRQGGDDRDFDDQRRQQKLLGRQEISAQAQSTSDGTRRAATAYRNKLWLTMSGSMVKQILEHTSALI